MLAEVYGWFTEGSETKDLQEAKALLKELDETAQWGNGKKDKGTGGEALRFVASIQATACPRCVLLASCGSGCETRATAGPNTFVSYLANSKSLF